MKKIRKETQKARLLTIIAGVMFMMLLAAGSEAAISGLSGTVFNLTARADHIATGDGGSVLFWGYASGTGRAQYPGPTFIVNQGDTITINLTNALPATAGPVSMVFPGQEGVSASGGSPGLLTQEAPADGATVVTYTFTAVHAGTYLYHSGTSPELQVEMGLLGAIIVRPYGYNMGSPMAYSHPDSAYNHEYLFLLTEMDPRIHQTIEFQGAAAINPDWLSDYFPGWWFINGRNAPDTMLPDNTMWLPTQPYTCMPLMHPGERLLMRVVDAGRDQHPFHHHGNHARVIAKDGRLLDTGAGEPMVDLSYIVFTIQAVPGETVDAIFEWTSKGLGWDIYGNPNDPAYAHECNGAGPDNIDPATGEDCDYHGALLEDKVVLPQPQALTFGGFWSGSPFLGSLGSLPPGEGGLNPNGGLVFMWHSHTEKEMSNYDIFPGGLMTMLIIEAPGVPIMH